MMATMPGSSPGGVSGFGGERLFPTYRATNARSGQARVRTQEFAERVFARSPAVRYSLYERMFDRTEQERPP